MALLNQIIAVEQGIKNEATSHIDQLYKMVQKPSLFNGFTKTYKPNDENGDKLPAENLHVQVTTKEIFKHLEHYYSSYLDVTARKDWTNCVAKADVVVDGEVILKDVPVTFLLFLEKQLTHLRTIITHMPILDPAEEWTFDSKSGFYKTSATETHRTKKVQKSLVLLAPTEHHPGQAVQINEDEIVGYWSQVKMSGALPRPDKEALLEKVGKLMISVKEAREQANITEEVESVKVGNAIFKFLTEE